MKLGAIKRVLILRLTISPRGKMKRFPAPPLSSDLSENNCHGLLGELFYAFKTFLSKYNVELFFRVGLKRVQAYHNVHW